MHSNFKVLDSLVSLISIQKREEVNAACYSDLDDENTSDCTLLIKKAPDSKTLSVLVNNVSATHAEVS